MGECHLGGVQVGGDARTFIDTLADQAPQDFQTLVRTLLHDLTLLQQALTGDREGGREGRERGGREREGVREGKARERKEREGNRPCYMASPQIESLKNTDIRPYSLRLSRHGTYL